MQPLPRRSHKRHQPSQTGQNAICRTCHARGVKCSKERPTCTVCKKAGRECIWADDDSHSQKNGGLSHLPAVDTAMPKDTEDSKIDEDGNGSTSLVSSRSDDSSTLSSINFDLLDEMEGKENDDDIDGEDQNGRKRKAEEIGTKEQVRGVKRVRQETTLNEIGANIGDQQAHIEMKPSTGQTTLVSSMPKGSSTNTATELTTEEPAPTLDFLIPIIPKDILPTESTLRDISSTADNTHPSPSNSSHLSAEHILLARIPGSNPLKPSTITKACDWLAKLLTDGNGVDMMEIKSSLGIRIYREEELPAYQQLRKEVAQEQARRNAQDLADALEMSAKRNGAAANTIKTGGFASEEANEIEGSQETSNVKDVEQASSDPPYTLRLRLKPGYRGNQWYTSNGTPKTEGARKKLVAKYEAGETGVIRVSEMR